MYIGWWLGLDGVGGRKISGNYAFGAFGVEGCNSTCLSGATLAYMLAFLLEFAQCDLYCRGAAAVAAVLWAGINRASGSCLSHNDVQSP